MARLRKHWLRYLVHILALIPFIMLAWNYYRLQHHLPNDLTKNPIQAITFRTGKTALIILILSLVVTPLNTLFGLKLQALRRPLGLYAFFYVTLHLLTFTVLDYTLDWDLISEAILKKRYVLVGFTAWLLLVPLALTSTKWAMRRLGRRWKPLHLLVYPIALLAILHFVWLVKADVREPLSYGLAVVLLLALRLPTVRGFFVRLRQRLAPAQSQPARRAS